MRSLGIAALIAAEALAFYALAELLAGGQEGNPGTVPGILFVLVGLTAYGSLRLADSLDFSDRASALAVAAAAFVLIYGSLRLTFSGDLALWDFGWVGKFLDNAELTMREGAETIVPAVLLIAVWARSAARANDDIELELVPRAVGVPFIVVTALVVVAAATERAGEVSRAGMAFYATAVAAMASSQLARSGATFGQARAGGVTAVLLGGTFAATAACVVIFGLAFGWLRPMIGPPLAAGTEAVLTFVLYPPAWVLEHVMRWLLQDARFPNLSEAVTNQSTEAAGESGGNGESSLQRVSTFLFRALALAIFLGLLALVVLWFSRLRRRMRAEPDQPITTAVAGSLGDDLRGLWRGLFRRQTSAQRAAAGATPAERLYLEVAAQGSRAGEPRQPFETPEEYAPRLRETLRSPVTDEITAAFEQSRYAGREPDSRTLAELERRWRQGS